MINLHPNFIKKNGKKEFAVLPYEEYLELQNRLEDFEDLVMLRQAKEEGKNDPTITLEDAKNLLGVK